MRLSRRELMGLWGLGLATVVSGCSDALSPRPTGAPLAPPARGASPSPAVAVPVAHPGPPVVVTAGPPGTRTIALTIDDGYDAATVAAYVEFARITGTHLTFSPNGSYAAQWAPHASALRPLIEAGAVQIGNHTFSHPDLRRLSDGQIRAEIERNEEWVRQTFATSTLPWFRPPYGAHDHRTDEVAGGLGFTRILLWNGSFGDSRLLSPDVLLSQARRYLTAGTVMLGHANHPTITGLFGSVLELLRERDLRPVTLDEMFGTRRVAP